MIPRILTVLCLTILASCVTPGTQQVRVGVPTPCADSTYRQLRSQHPDSLSERGWQRLQNLDRACATREESSGTGTTDATHRGSRMWLGAAVMMVAMMVAMR